MPVVDEHTKVLLYLLVHTLGLTISLRVIGSRWVAFYTEELVQGRDEL